MCGVPWVNPHLKLVPDNAFVIHRLSISFGHKMGDGLFQTVNGQLVHGENIIDGHDGLGIAPHIFGYGV